MPSESRLQQLVNAGVADNTDAFSEEAGQVIESLSDEEFASLLSIRQKVVEVGGEEAQRKHDACLTVIF
jgi:aromatic ring-opening dioxygenase LigB subunit